MDKLQTSLGRLMKASGIDDWEQIFPDQICSGCKFFDYCANQKHKCKAFEVIGMMASITLSKEGDSPKIFVSLLKSGFKMK
ncbi:hypothetical protein ACFL2L_01570 [Patescibacteria group bacterium]